MMANAYLDRSSKAGNFSFFRRLFSRPRGLEFGKMDGGFKKEARRRRKKFNMYTTTTYVYKNPTKY